MEWPLNCGLALLNFHISYIKNSAASFPMNTETAKEMHIRCLHFKKLHKDLKGRSIVVIVTLLKRKAAYKEGGFIWVHGLRALVHQDRKGIAEQRSLYQDGEQAGAGG